MLFQLPKPFTKTDFVNIIRLQKTFRPSQVVMIAGWGAIGKRFTPATLHYVSPKKIVSKKTKFFRPMLNTWIKQILTASKFLKITNAFQTPPRIRAYAPGIRGAPYSI